MLESFFFFFCYSVNLFWCQLLFSYSGVNIRWTLSSQHRSVLLMFPVNPPNKVNKTIRLILPAVACWTVRKFEVHQHLSHRRHGVKLLKECLSGYLKWNILRAGIRLTLLYVFSCVQIQQWLCQLVWKLLTFLLHVVHVMPVSTGSERCHFHQLQLLSITVNPFNSKLQTPVC